MTVPQTITSEIQKLEPSAIVELFELDATAIGGEVLRFHAGTNGLRQNVVWQGNTYTAFPMQATGFDYTGNGQLPRPKMIMSNASGAMTLLVLSFDDMLGTKVTRRRTLAKYLDAVNFPARRNLITVSVPNNTQWGINPPTPGTPNFGIAPDGNLATYRTVGGAGTIYRPGSTTAGQVYTYSIFVKTAADLFVRMYVDGAIGTGGIFGSAVANAANVNSAFSLSGGNGVQAISASATPIGIPDWYRLSFSFIPAGGAATNVHIYPAISNEQEWWGAQLDPGSSATEYQPVGTTWSQNPTADPAAEFPVDIFYIDRKASETKDAVEFELSSSFDVAGVQLPRRQIIQNVCTWRYRGTECGWTTPPDRRNLLVYSQQFEQASWSKADATIVSNAGLAPDGTMTADQVTYTLVTTSTGYVVQGIIASIAIGNQWTFSSYVKSSLRAIRFGGATPAGTDVYSQTDVGSGWFRQSVTRTFTVASASAQIQALYYGWDPAGAGPYLIWGAQLEVGSTLTDYQPIGASYTNPNYFDANDAAVGTLALDVCGKRLSSCKTRFGTNNPLPFGNFPAAGLTR